MGLDDLLAPLDWGRQAVSNTGEGLSGLLGGDLTRQNFAKVLPGVAGLGAGLLTGGTWALPAAALAASLTQGIGKQFNPVDMKAPTTQELVGRFGGDPESTWQNLGVGLATDPWLYAGLGMGAGLARGGSAAGKAARIASAASGAEEAGTAAEAGIGAGRQGLRASMGFAAPETADAAGTGSRLSEMLKLRRGVGKVEWNPLTMEIDPIGKQVANPLTGDIEAAGGRYMGDDELELVGQKLAKEWGPFHGIKGWQGTSPEGVVIASDPAVASREALRHEMYHALLAEAGRTGETAGLTPLQKMAHYLQKTATGPEGASPREALARMLNETGAHAAEQSSPLSQLLGGGKYLFGGQSPASGLGRAGYSAELHSISPSVGKLFDILGHAPEAAKIGGLGAAVGGASALAYPYFTR